MNRPAPNLARIVPLLALLAFALFPYGWLAEHSTLFDRLASSVFFSEAAHAVGHTVLFLGVGGALLAYFPWLLRRPGSYLALVALIAVAQESFQLLYKGRGVVVNDITDIGIDLVAAALVLTLVRLAAARRARAMV